MSPEQRLEVVDAALDQHGGSRADERLMRRVELLGSHDHVAEGGRRVNIWIRSDKYLARGSFEGRRFGETLGDNEHDAKIRLHEMLAELGNGTYRPPSDASRRMRRTLRVPKSTVAQICQQYVADRREVRGKKTARRYANWLLPVIAFSEQADVAKQYPLARDIDRDYAMRLRAFLQKRLVTGNGRTGATPHPISQRGISDVLRTFRAALEFARHLENQLLPASFINPITTEIIGVVPSKDPMRAIDLPLSLRVKLTHVGDCWALSHVVPLFLLPVRPSEWSGLLINEIDWVARLLRFGTRFGGRDFTKGKVSFQVPFPPELEPVFRGIVRNRTGGPLLQSRAVFEGRRAGIEIHSAEHFDQMINEAISRAGPTTSQDSKAICRNVIRQVGGTDPDELAREFKRLLGVANISRPIRLYSCREAVTTELSRARMPMLQLRYATGHTQTDILNEYVTHTADDLQSSFEAYWATIPVLLHAIEEHAVECGFALPPDRDKDWQPELQLVG